MKLSTFKNIYIHTIPSLSWSNDQKFIFEFIRLQILEPQFGFQIPFQHFPSLTRSVFTRDEIHKNIFVKLLRIKQIQSLQF